jgi:hypothetical protein
MKNLQNAAKNVRTTTRPLNNAREFDELSSGLPFEGNIPMLRWGGGGRI